MVRTYKRKTERGAYGDETLKAALLALEEQPLKTVGCLYNNPTRTLRRHRDNMVCSRGALALGPKKPALPTTAERTLRDHISYMEKCLYGLTTVETPGLRSGGEVGSETQLLCRNEDGGTRLAARFLQTARRPSNPATTRHQHCAGCRVQPTKGTPVLRTV